MSGIKYYTIRDDEELPDEFAVVENVGGEPEIRAWYSRNEELIVENAKLRERAVAMLSELRGVVSEGDYDSPSGRYWLLRKDVAAYEDALRELGVEV